VLIDLAGRADWNLAIGSRAGASGSARRDPPSLRGYRRRALRAVAQPQCRELTSAFGSIVRGDEDEND